MPSATIEQPPAPIAPAATLEQSSVPDLSRSTLPSATVNQALAFETKERAHEAVTAEPARNVLRVTQSVAQYDVSTHNPHALSNLAKAVAGCIDRDDLTFLDPETRTETPIGTVLVAVDLSDTGKIVLTHRDTAGKGLLGRIVESCGYMIANPLKTIGMKTLGVVADPEVIYKQKVIQVLAQLDREGLFGPPGASTFNIDDWNVTTRYAWRDVVITPKEKR